MTKQPSVYTRHPWVDPAPFRRKTPQRFFFQMRVSDDFLHRLDEMRRTEPDLPSRSALARRLLEKAMNR